MSSKSNRHKRPSRGAIPTIPEPEEADENAVDSALQRSADDHPGSGSVDAGADEEFPLPEADLGASDEPSSEGKRGKGSPVDEIITSSADATGRQERDEEPPAVATIDADSEGHGNDDVAVDDHDHPERAEGEEDIGVEATNDDDADEGDLEAWAEDEDAWLETRDDDKDDAADAAEEWEQTADSDEDGPDADESAAGAVRKYREAAPLPSLDDDEFRARLPDSEMSREEWDETEAEWEAPQDEEFRGDGSTAPTGPSPSDPLRFYRTTRDEDLKTEGGPRRRSRRKRKPVDHTPDWDRDGAPVPAAEPERKRAPEVAERTVEGDATEPGGDGARGQRRSLRRKKRLPTKLERMFISSPKLFTVLLGIIIVTVVLVGTIGALKVARQSTDSAIQQARSASIANPTLDPEAEGLLPFFLTSENLKMATQAVQNYLEADGWEQKLAFVRRPSVARELMPVWYSLPDNIGRDASASLGEVMLSKQTPIDGMTIVMLAAMVEPDNRIQIFAVQKISDDTFKVDWEVSEGYQELPLHEFRSTKPTEPRTFRVQVERSDYFNGEFSDPEKYAVYKVTYPSFDAFEIYGYVEKGSPAEADFEDAVPAGISASLMVRMRFPENAVESNQVILTELVHSSWFPGYERGTGVGAGSKVGAGSEPASPEAPSVFEAVPSAPAVEDEANVSLD